MKELVIRINDGKGNYEEKTFYTSDSKVLIFALIQRSIDIITKEEFEQSVKDNLNTN